MPVFITFLDTGLNAALHSSGEAVVLQLAALIVAGWADQSQMRVTGLDHWTLNLFLPVGRDVISHCGIKKNTHLHTKGAITFSVLLSRVTAWVNRLLEVSENWISELALLFSAVLALKLYNRQVKMPFKPTCFTTQGCIFYYFCQLITSKYDRQGNPFQTFSSNCRICIKDILYNSMFTHDVLYLFSFTDNCNGPLVSTLPHSSFQSSSQSSASYAAYNAKLNRRDGEYNKYVLAWI